MIEKYIEIIFVLHAKHKCDRLPAEWPCHYLECERVRHSLNIELMKF